MNREDLKPIILDALHSAGHKEPIAKVAKYIWDNYEADLRASGDFFYTWQYDMRWASNGLVKEGSLDKTSHRGLWERLK